MNQTTATLNPALVPPRAKKSGGFYQRAVMQTLEQMTLGCLHLELPDGTKHTIGRPGAAISANVRIADWGFFKRCVLFGDVGFGEAYVDSDWDTDDITKVISWFILNVENSPAMSGGRGKKFLINLLGWQNRIRHLLRPNSLTTSRRNISEHYDLGNDFYKLFLDPTMTYSSALFEDGLAAQQRRPTLVTLEEAQVAKYDRLCRQLKLKPGEHVLEIGSGWGGFSRHAAKNYGVRITTVTISEEQFKYARELFQKEGLADRVEIKLQDYRLLEGKFDKIVSIEMLEAVGDEFLETYFAKCHELLEPHGLLALQMITCPDSRHDSLRKNVDWIQKHIFPGSLLLSIHRVNEALRRTGDLFLYDLKDLGLSYAETLKRWRVTFNQNEASVRALKFDTRFVRKWNYYLSYCEAAFAMRNISVVQAVYTRPNNQTTL
ncbi:MAG TPA: cyclopropane-fatty-acyl-phospholipid synthase family protein [Candidatus Acidoferrales bacterium]|jgi:cyclopropane-fatty-acyl-phospholipid synthase|nr:cyclopropane-fatty-acyl-phospholipid synthase family protein [Candidatus Acidoferrales bacterium]